MQDELHDKLILLFVFDKMEIPVTEKTLLDLCCVDNAWLNYMTCKDLVPQLIEAGFVFISNNAAGSLMNITTDGRECLNHFFTRLPSTLREEIFTYIKANRIVYRRKQEYFSDYYKNPDGTYTVCLKIIGVAQPVMELKLVVPDRTKAKWIYKNWEENAPNIYGLLYSNLVEAL